MFIWFGYYLYNKNILVSIIIGTYIYLILYKYTYIYQLYIIDLIMTILSKYKIENKILDKCKEKKIKCREKKIEDNNKYSPTILSINYTLGQTYKNVYASNIS